jgi:hypothetical protein
MKKIFLSAAVVAALCSIVFAQDKKGDPVLDNYKLVGAPLPEMRLFDTARKEYTEKSFDSNHNLFLFMFNPTCGHCINMAKLVGENYKVFKKNDIVFMAGPQMLSYLNSFYQATKIGNYPEIVVGVDSAFAVEKIYNYHTLPQLNIYNKERKLIKTFQGDIPLDSLKKYAK